VRIRAKWDSFAQVSRQGLWDGLEEQGIHMEPADFQRLWY
jgi:hypothetical protein